MSCSIRYVPHKNEGELLEWLLHLAISYLYDDMEESAEEPGKPLWSKQQHKGGPLLFMDTLIFTAGLDCHHCSRAWKREAGREKIEQAQYSHLHCLKC